MNPGNLDEFSEAIDEIPEASLHTVCGSKSVLLKPPRADRHGVRLFALMVKPSLTNYAGRRSIGAILRSLVGIWGGKQAPTIKP